MGIGMTFVFEPAAVSLGRRHHLGADVPDGPGDGIAPSKLSLFHILALLSQLALAGPGL